MSGDPLEQPGRRPRGRPGRCPTPLALLLTTLLVALTTALGPSAGAQPTPSPTDPTASEDGSTEDPADPDDEDPEEPEDPAEPEEPEDPLVVDLRTLSPAAIPERGPVTVTGTVVNETGTRWTDVNVYALASAAPLTTSAELTEAAASPADTFIGERIVDDESYFAVLGDLAPGASRSFEVRLPRAVLPDAGEGVYWFGLQALGAGPDGARDTLGRARTFLPLLDGDESVGTALVQPLRHPVRRDQDGRVRNVEQWAASLAPAGRLDRLLDFGAEAAETGATLTWLLDPAVPDTVSDLVARNPGLSIAPTVGVDGQEPAPSEEPSPSESGLVDQTEPLDPDADRDAADPADVERAAVSGSRWLRQLGTTLADGRVLTLPYGDLDVDASLRFAPVLYDRARIRSAAVAAQQRLDDVRPVVAPPSGTLDPLTLGRLSPSDTVVVADSALDADALAEATAGTERPFDPAEPTAVSVEGRTVVVSDSGVARGGPSPGDPLTELAVRQRFLAEAAVRAVAAQAAGTPATLVTTLPDEWLPVTGTGFFRELADVDWLDVSPLADVVAAADGQDRGPVEVGAEALSYPEAARESEPGSLTMAGARRLVRVAGTLQDVLPLNDTVAAQAVDEVLVALGYDNRQDLRVATRSVAQVRRHVEGLLGRIDVETPTELTLSSESGDFSVTLSNGLTEPVVVRLRAVTDGLVRVTAPEEVEVPPEAVTTVPMTASSARAGRSVVDVQVVDGQGNPVGASAELPVRSIRIGNVIWWILGVGASLLALAIALRLVRRVRGARSAATG